MASRFDWSICRLFLVMLCSFFVGGLLFISYLHPKPSVILKRIMEYYQHTFIGIDASALLAMDCDKGCSFIHNADDTNMDILQELSYVGINTIKVRLFHTPSADESYANFTNVIQIATRIYEQNMYFHLCIHYSDTYSNATHQKPPKAWKHILHDQPKIHQQVRNYTFNVLSTLSELSLLPHIVSIGNEINNGFLLDQQLAHLERCPEDEDYNCAMIDKTWNNYALLLKSAIEAVRDVSTDIEIMAHSSDMNLKQVEYMFIEQLLYKYHVQFDIIGITWNECKESDPLYFDEIIRKRLTLFADDNVHNLRLMITEFTNMNVNCFKMLMDVASSNKLIYFVGVEWFNGVKFRKLKNKKEKMEMLFSELRTLTESTPKPKKLNWTYVILTVMFVGGIAYNHCFWKNARHHQQIQFSAIVKKG